MKSIEAAAAQLDEQIVQPLDRLFAVMHTMTTDALKDAQRDEFDWFTMASQLELCAARIETLKDTASYMARVMRDVATDT